MSITLWVFFLILFFSTYSKILVKDLQLQKQGFFFLSQCLNSMLVLGGLCTAKPFGSDVYKPMWILQNHRESAVAETLNSGIPSLS